MKVLFVPYYAGGFSHFIPLVSLSRMLEGSSVEAAFLLPADLREYGAALGLEVLPVEYRGNLQSELKAYGHFGPDVVVDDCSLTTGYATTLAGKPRVAIQRTGIFPFQTPRNPDHLHSLGLRVDQIPDLSHLGLRQPRTMADCFEAAVKIVPGIPQIEVLPAEVRDDASYLFSGPLTIEDLLWGASGGGSGGASPGDVRDFTPLEEFLESQRERPTVYFTYGLIARPPAEIVECMRRLLERGAAVVSSIRVDELLDRYRGRYFHSAYLPMHLVCSRVRLAVHHCGSATYHYPLLHDLPSLTVGTRCHDRDDVAVRLADLGLSRHLPAPAECDGFVARFEEEVEGLLEDREGRYSAIRERVAAVGEEIRRTAAGFDLVRVLDRVMVAA